MTRQILDMLVHDGTEFQILDAFGVGLAEPGLVTSGAEGDRVALAWDRTDNMRGWFADYVTSTIGDTTLLHLGAMFVSQPHVIAVVTRGEEPQLELEGRPVPDDRFGYMIDGHAALIPFTGGLLVGSIESEENSAPTWNPPPEAYEDLEELIFDNGQLVVRCPLDEAVAALRSLADPDRQLSVDRDTFEKEFDAWRSECLAYPYRSLSDADRHWIRERAVLILVADPSLGSELGSHDFFLDRNRVPVESHAGVEYRGRVTPGRHVLMFRRGRVPRQGRDESNALEIALDETGRVTVYVGVKAGRLALWVA